MVPGSVPNMPVTPRTGASGLGVSKSLVGVRTAEPADTTLEKRERGGQICPPNQRIASLDASLALFFFGEDDWSQDAAPFALQRTVLRGTCDTCCFTESHGGMT